MMNPFNAPSAPVPMDAAKLITVYPRLKAWSYSRVNNHKTCPLKLRFSTPALGGSPEPDNEYQARGQSVHKELGSYVRNGCPLSDGDPFPPAWRPLLDMLHKLQAQSELQVAFTREWAPCLWYAPEAWCRVVLDAMHIDTEDDGSETVCVTEFKTGKKYPEHQQQMRLYALAGLLLVPEATSAIVDIWYIDRPNDPKPTYSAQRTMLPALQQEFVEFSHDLLHDDMYPAKPGTHCDRCHYRKSNQGPCHHG